MKYEKPNLSEDDNYRLALSRCRLYESSMPQICGRLVENVDCYNKVNRIVNTPEMEDCHKFCYNLDVENISEAEEEKVNTLYKLGQDRGIIPEDEEDEDEDEDSQEDNDDTIVTNECDGIVQMAVSSPVGTKVAPCPPESSYSIFYSAMKNGELKTGECFSNGSSPKFAKVDALGKLTRLGYDAVEILAIEINDPDADALDASYGPVNSPENIYTRQDHVRNACRGRQNLDDILSDVIDDDDDDDDCDISGKAYGMQELSEDDKEEEKDPKADDKKDEDTDKDKEEPPEDDKEIEDLDAEETDEELPAAEKTSLMNQYKRAFKAAMLKGGFKTSFNDLSLNDKVKFFTNLLHGWESDVDPSKFLSAKEIEALNGLVFTK